MVDCQNCGKEQNKLLESKDFNRKISDIIFPYFHCQSCGMISLDPIPDDLGSYYENSYYGPVPKSAEDLLAAAKVYEKYKIDIVKQYCPDIETVLEIGPSMGGFALLCKDAGLKVRAIEMDSECSRFLNEVAEIPTNNSNDEIAALKDEPETDLLVMWHVVEHLRKPFELLRESYKKVKPGGFILIAAPNPESLQFRVLKEHWVHLDAPRHTHLIPIKALEKDLSENGFDIVVSTTTDEGGIKWNEFGWEHSKKPGFAPNRIKQKFYAVSERFFNLGSCYTTIAQKKI